MDGLVAACKAALDGGTAPERHGSAPHISVLVKDETLAQAAAADAAQAPARYPAPGAAAAPGLARPASPAAPATRPGARTRPVAAARRARAPGADRARHMLTARQVLALCCGAQIGAIRWHDGLPLDVGRTARTEPPGLRRALEARDQGCRWTDCGALAAWATAHHIRPWSQGGATSLEDLALFCHVHHHYFIHILGWTITGDPNGTLHFTHPGGWLTLDSPLPATEPGRPGSTVLVGELGACPAPC